MSASLSQIREYISLDEVDIVLHHGWCCDGFGGAWAVWMASSRDDVLVYGCSHLAKQDEVNKIIEMCTDKNVLMIDFTFKADVLKEINNVSKKFAILDHHVTAFDEVKQADMESQSVLDVEHSGCWLGWKYCYPDEELPEFLRYIQDRDLWRYELENTKAFVASFYPTVDYDLDEWLKLRDEDVVKQHITDGKVILKHQNLEIENMARRAKDIYDWRGYNIKAINATTLISDLGNHLAKECDLALLWWYDADKDVIKVSLRSDSEGNNVNVAKIASEFGGGGHTNAAGFSWAKSIQELLYPLHTDSNNGSETKIQIESPQQSPQQSQYDETVPLLIDEHQSLEEVKNEAKAWTKRLWLTIGIGIASASIGFVVGFFIPK